MDHRPVHVHSSTIVAHRRARPGNAPTVALREGSGRRTARTEAGRGSADSMTIGGEEMQMTGFGMQAHALNLWRVLGGALMVAGVALVALF